MLGLVSDGTHFLVHLFFFRSYCHASPLLQSYCRVHCRLSVDRLLSQSCELLREVRGAVS